MAKLLKNEIDLISQYDENIITSYNFEELELEMRLGLSTEKFGDESNLFNYAEFKRVINYLNKVSINERNIKNKKSLDIFISKTEKVNFNEELNNLRFTINDIDNIGKYCRTGLLSNHEVIYKGRFDWENREPLRNGKKPRCNIDIESYRLRLGGKVEIPIKEEDKVKSWTKMISDPDNKKLLEYIDLANKEYDLATNLINKNGFDKLYKTYRLKDRSSFYINLSDNIDARIDCTIVKSSKTEINDYGYDEQVGVLNFIDSKIAESDERYEIEIELIRLTPLKQGELKKVLIDFIYTHLSKIYEIAYDIPIYTTITEKNDVLNLYSLLVKKIYIEKMQRKNEILEDVSKYRELKSKGINIDTDKIQKLLDKYPSQYDYFNLVKDLSKNVDELLNENNKMISSIERNFERGEYSKSKYFMSPRVVSISMDDIRPENPNSILNDYTVTEKADGLGMLLFKIGLKHLNYEESKKYAAYNNRLYMIDSNMNVINTGLEYDDESLVKGSIIFNGEYLRYGRGEIASTRPIINKYGIFDTYIYDDIDTTNLPLISKNNDDNTRLKYANLFLKQTEGNIINNISNLEIFLKEFLIATSNSNIFEKTKKIWDKYKSGVINYKLDGTIYTPVYAPVGFNDENYNYDITIHKTWNKNLKWKPHDDNTIDFLIQFEKDTVASLGDRKLMQDKIKSIVSIIESKTVSNKYKIGNLYNGGQEILKSPPCSDKRNEIKYGVQRPILFKPKHPQDDDIYYGYFATELINNKYIVKDLEGEPVLDNTIIEVAYLGYEPNEKDYEKNKNLRWKILRTRHDKTFSYKLGLSEQKKAFELIKKAIKLANSNTNLNEKQLIIFDRIFKYIRDIPQVKSSINGMISKYDLFKKNIKIIEERILSPVDIDVKNINFGNNVNVAENIWMTMHNPVTESIITTGKGIPSIPDEEDKYYLKPSTAQHRDKSITIGLQNFHNKFIKNRLLIGNVANFLRKSGSQKISLLDLACGKGGDIAKWRDNEIDICVGIDSVRNNIYDTNDGACERYQFYKNQKQFKGKLPDAYFLQGDVSKSFEDEKTFGDLQSNILYKKLWYPDMEYQTNFKEVGFDIISIMFALHYFMKDKTSFDNLIQNISRNLKKGGFLIGCCFDGNRIFELLKDLPLNESYNISLSGKNILRLIKNYIAIDNKYTDDENSLSMQLGVYIHAIGKIHDEFLVNFNYLVSELSKVGIYPVKQEEMGLMNLPLYSGKSYGSFEDAFRELQKMYDIDPLAKDIVNTLTEEEKKVSFLNNYFVFRKETESEALINRVVNNLTIKLQSRKDIIEWILENKWSEVRKIIRAELGEIDNESWDIIIDKMKSGIKSGDIIVQKPSKKVKQSGSGKDTNSEKDTKSKKDNKSEKDTKSITDKKVEEQPEIKTILIENPVSSMLMSEEDKTGEILDDTSILIIDENINKPEIIISVENELISKETMELINNTLDTPVCETLLEISDNESIDEKLDEQVNIKNIRLDISNPTKETKIESLKPRIVKKIQISKSKKLTSTQKSKFMKIYDNLYKTLDNKGYLNPDITSIPPKYKETINEFIETFNDDLYIKDADVNERINKIKNVLNKIKK